MPDYRKLVQSVDRREASIRGRTQRRNGKKAGIITAAGKSPVYGDFNEPVACEEKELITVSASALSQFSKSRSSGSHYSSDGTFPSVAGAASLARTAAGRRPYIVPPSAPSR